METKNTDEPRIIISGRILAPGEIPKIVAPCNPELPPISELEHLREEKEYYKKHARLNAQYVRVLIKDGEQLDIPPETRQREPAIRKYLARGYTRQQIAFEIGCSKRTVDYDVKKLGLQRKQRRK